MITTIFCEIDDFCKFFKKFLIDQGATTVQKRNKKNGIEQSEVMTISVYYHYSGFKNFKSYYLNYVRVILRGYFPKLVSYNRFVELMNSAVMPLAFFCKLVNSNECTGISFIDSFSLPACHIKRCYSHKVFKGVAKKGKTSVGWFFGFKVHFVINHRGEIIDFCLTSGNVADCNIKVIDSLTKNVSGKLFGDKGYLGKKLFSRLWDKGIKMVTRIRKNMKNILMDLQEKLLLKKRPVIESSIAILKEKFSVSSTRYRSHSALLVNLFSGLVAYAFKPQKPSISFDQAVLGH